MSSNLARRGDKPVSILVLELEGGEWVKCQAPATLPPEEKPVTYLQGMCEKAAVIVSLKELKVFASNII